ncbi:hypothetical protein H2203_000499 [Taxawa tesnikishii (nom. ined.)]|nr:hypothetical protein H2203_000499 [Dothideales sp. JES 119]
MTSYTTAQPSAMSAKSTSSHGKLHKRAGSASSVSLTSPSSVPYALHDAFPTDTSSSPQKTTSTQKIKPYLRKMSLKDEDQGRLDLSRPAAENEKLAGLGMNDLGSSRSASDLAYLASGRRSLNHNRTASVNSQISSQSFRPTEPFVHPMRQRPRPYTPPSYAHSAADEEGDESTDVVPTEDLYSIGRPDLEPWRSRRSMSVSSTPQVMPTPLSQSHTADSMTNLTKNANASQSNLSIRSAKSAKSSRSNNQSATRGTRSRGNTNRSLDLGTSPSSRTSFDKAFAFLSSHTSRTSEGEDAATREAKIRAARRAYEEKEAAKDRKIEKEEAKRRDAEEAKRLRKDERQRRRSEASGGNRKKSLSLTAGIAGSRPDLNEKGNEAAAADAVAGREYERHAPVHVRSLPVQGRESGRSEATRGRSRSARPRRRGVAGSGSWLG